jgi:phosphoglycolate phosphatase
LMDHTVAYPGMLEELARAMHRGPLAVLTNKPLGPSSGLLEALGLRGFFSRIIGGDSEYGRKPDPAGLHALKALAPDDAIVMIGDSPADWKVAEAAGCPFVFARYGFGAAKFGDGPPATPFVVDHPRELSAVLGAIR